MTEYKDGLAIQPLADILVYFVDQSTVRIESSFHTTHIVMGDTCKIYLEDIKVKEIKNESKN